MSVLDTKEYRHVGYSHVCNGLLDEYYSLPTVRLISRKVTELTRGVDPQNRPILVPDENIYNVMASVHREYKPPVGDPYSRYVQVTDEQNNMIQGMIDQTIELIVSDIVGNMKIEQANSMLSPWVNVRGDFNPHGLMFHDKIKTREKRPTPMQFHMRY